MRLATATTRRPSTTMGGSTTPAQPSASTAAGARWSGGDRTSTVSAAQIWGPAAVPRALTSDSGATGRGLPSFYLRITHLRRDKDYQEVAVLWRRRGHCGVRRRLPRAYWSAEFSPPVAQPLRPAAIGQSDGASRCGAGWTPYLLNGRVTGGNTTAAREPV